MDIPLPISFGLTDLATNRVGQSVAHSMVPHLMDIQKEVAHLSQTMEYDGTTDEIVLVSAPDRRVLRYPARLQGDATVAELPDWVPLDDEVFVAVDPVTGHTWIGSGASSKLFE